jgi:NMD protein affecting ribosome stability and mRNA decay
MNPSKWAARKRAQRAKPNLSGEKCQQCGATERLERHHPDYSKPDLFVVLCDSCHIRADQSAGFQKKKKTRRCSVCGKEFIPNHSKKHTTCSRECLSEIGRRNAAKRTYHSNRYTARSRSK